MLGAIGGILGGLGSFAGGLSSLFNSGGGGGNNNWMFNEQMQLAREQLHFQQEAAKMGIRWRVADAKEAGLHPLFALTGQTFQPSPISVSPVQGEYDRGQDVGGALERMGQGVSRAIAATQTKQERHLTELELAAASQDAASRQLDLEMKRTQLAMMQEQLRRNQGQLGPPMPSGSPTTAATGQATIKENEITSSQPDAPSAAAGPIAPSNQWRIAPDGSAYPTPEKNLQMDDMGSPGWLPWMYRNHVLPYAEQVLGKDVQYAAPPKSELPPGAIAWRKHVDGSWSPVYPSIPDRDIESTRHNRVVPKWADPKYRRY